jgi:hypothetical protein
MKRAIFINKDQVSLTYEGEVVDPAARIQELLGVFRKFAPSSYEIHHLISANGVLVAEFVHKFSRDLRWIRLDKDGSAVGKKNSVRVTRSYYDTDDTNWQSDCAVSNLFI